MPTVAKISLSENETLKGAREIIAPKGKRKKPIAIEGVFLSAKNEEKSMEIDEMITSQLTAFGFFSK